MKTRRTSDRNRQSRTTERGSATIVMIALLAILFILISTNSRTVFNLQKELKLIERQQIERSKPNHGHATNTVAKSSAAIRQSP